MNYKNYKVNDIILIHTDVINDDGETFEDLKAGDTYTIRVIWPDGRIEVYNNYTQKEYVFSTKYCSVEHRP